MADDEEVPYEIRRVARFCGELYDRIPLYHVYQEKLKEYMRQRGFTTMSIEGQTMTLEDGLLYFGVCREG